MSGFDRQAKQLVLAMDHARAMGPVTGLERPEAVVDMAIEGGANAIMTSFGTLRLCKHQLAGAGMASILRLDGGVALVHETWLANSEYRLLHTLEEALSLGADAVCLMYFMGAECEMETLENVAEMASECEAAGMALMVEALPCAHPNIPNPNDAGMMATACRIAFEHGADILKTYYSGSVEGFRGVVEGTPAPVLIAGGPKLDSDEAVFAMVADVTAAGGKGVVFGRNIWQNTKPVAMMKALGHVIRKEGSASEAAEIYAGG
ncbi:MAG: class I fructose-bisphosphate aldolase [Geminicoccaceae bacterium]